MTNKIVYVLFGLLLVVCIISIFSFVVYYNRVHTNTIKTTIIQNELVDDITPSESICDTHIIKCKKRVSQIGKCNSILKSFFEDEGFEYSEKYIDDPMSVLPGIVLANYDQQEKKVIEVLPIKMYNKILYQKLSTSSDPNLEIAIFVVNFPIGQKKSSSVFNIYHSALIFVEKSKYTSTFLTKDILFCLELWGRGGGKLGLASCMYPVIESNTIDINSQTLNKIIIEFPEAFGCENDGTFWGGSFENTTYMGSTSVLNIEKLYDLSINWLSTNWGYTAVSLVSSLCTHKIPIKAVIGNTCDSFVQAMCTELERIDPTNFKGLIMKVKWNDVQIVGSWEKVDLRSKKNIINIKKYLSQVDIIYKTNTKENFEINFPTILSILTGNMLLHKIINFMKKYIFHNQLYIASFNKNTFEVYKVNLMYPYIKNIYSLCPGFMYKYMYKYNN